MITTEHFCQLDLVVIALTHFTAIHGDHVIVHPVTYRRDVIASSALRDLTFMMRKLKVHAAAVDVELRAEIFCTHGRALDMPAGKTNAPGTLPAHDMFRRRIFP